MNKQRGLDFISILKELWMEVNVLRKAAVHMRQNFADPISMADMADSKNELSKVARNLFPIDIMQAKGLKKNSHERLSSISDIV